MIECCARISDGPSVSSPPIHSHYCSEAALMMTRLLRRWPRLLEARIFVGRTTVRPGRRRVRPYLVALKDRVAPAASVIPLDFQIDGLDGLDGPIAKIKQ